MRITKEIAQKVANQLLHKKDEQIEDLKIKVNDILKKEILSTIPNTIIAAFHDKTTHDYIDASGSVRLMGNGFNHEHYYLINSLPTKGGEIIINVSEKFSKLLMPAHKHLKISKREREITFDEVYVSLINLRTYANIEKQFPEAFLLLPPENKSMALLVNVDHIRNKIK